jgi:hypothetical protein
MASDEKILSFEIWVDGEAKETVETADESVTIGKTGGAAVLQVDDPSMTDLHCAVQRSEDGSYMLLDFGSESGTLLNGERVNNASVSTADVIECGNTKLVLSIGGEAAAAAEPEAPAAAPVADEPVQEADAEPPAPEEAVAPEVPDAPAAAEESGLDDEWDDVLDEHTEDVMTFVMRSGQADSELGVDRKQAPVIEIGQIWGDTLLDVKHLSVEDKSVVIGDRPHRPAPMGTLVGMAPIAAIGIGALTSSPNVASAAAGVSMLTLPAGIMFDEGRRLNVPQQFFISSDNLPTPNYKLVERVGSNVYVNFTEDYVGFVEENGSDRTSLADLVSSGRATKTSAGFQCELPNNGRFVVDIGHVIFFVQEVSSPKRVIPGVTQGMDFLFLGLFLLMAFVGLVLGIIIASLPYDPSQEVISIPDRFAEIQIEQPEEEKKKKDPTGNPDAGEGAKAKGEEGKVGKKDAKLKRAKGTKVAMAKATMDKQIAESAGILADLNTMEADNNMFGTGGIGVGASAFVGGVIGSQYGNQYGSGGLGSRGSGLGGGGSGEGLGGLGTRGRGRGASGYGSGGGYFGRKSSGTPGMSTGDPIILGALDKSVIDRVIKQHLSQIRYCYQKELNKNPGLYGKIVIKFVISKDGSVSSAKTNSTSMNNPIVENCICQRFMRFKFPQPKGGGIVIVSYPFVFKSG